MLMVVKMSISSVMVFIVMSSRVDSLLVNSLKDVLVMNVGWVFGWVIEMMIVRVRIVVL